MRRILRHVQQNVGQSWVGLSVVHLGDRDVPNGESHFLPSQTLTLPSPYPSSRVHRQGLLLPIQLLTLSLSTVKCLGSLARLPLA
jgi:hypothetical protein